MVRLHEPFNFYVGPKHISWTAEATVDKILPARRYARMGVGISRRRVSVCHTPVLYQNG